MIVATLSHDQMIDILRKPGSVTAVIVPPFQSGKPRKCVFVCIALSACSDSIYVFLPPQGYAVTHVHPFCFLPQGYVMTHLLLFY